MRRTDILNFNAEIAETPLLTREEEVSLARRIKEGDEEARRIMIVSNLRLVVFIAKSFAGQGNLRLEDLVAEGNIGLIEAVDKFDPDRGVKFSTYASGWIKRDIYRTLRDDSFAVRVHPAIRRNIKSIKKAKEDLELELGREATQEDVVDRTGLSPLVVKRLMNYKHYVISADEENYGEGPSEDEDLNSHYLVRDEIDYMNECLELLPDKTKEIIIMLYGLRGSKKHTQGEVGSKFGLTHQRIQQIGARGLERMRRIMGKRS
jgi:RNA polymerase primary sigma factor